VPVFKLTDQLIFPPPHLAEPDGLLAIGGDLTPQRLLLAYSSGLFPWFNEGQPPLWWTPDPRCIFEPGQMTISKSLAKVLRQGRFRVTCDTDFRGVITACAAIRKSQGEETWITEQLTEAFLTLFEMGYAHSIECWQDDFLAGGLYGVCLGRCFFGESMFHQRRDGSKVALAHLHRLAEQVGFELIDCQLPNDHLVSLGAREIPRIDFLARLEKAGVTQSAEPPRQSFNWPENGFTDW